MKYIPSKNVKFTSAMDEQPYRRPVQFLQLHVFFPIISFGFCNKRNLKNNQSLLQFYAMHSSRIINTP